MEEIVSSVWEGGIARKMVRSEALSGDFSLSLVACGSCATLGVLEGQSVSWARCYLVWHLVK